MRRLAFACALLFLASCRVLSVQESAPGGPVVDTLTLRAGESVMWNGVHVGFAGIVEDSRCAIDVACVWQGNAAAEVTVGPAGDGKGPTVHLILNTALDPRAGEAWGLRVALLDVHPRPVSTQRIPPDAYRVRLGVSALAP